MSIQKKSLIKSLKATKKANVAASAPATNEGAATRKTKVAYKKVDVTRMSRTNLG
jgi:hypothetical protein